MTTTLRNWVLAGLVGLLVACSGSGGGDSAPGVEPGPPGNGGPVDPPPPDFPQFTPAPYAEADRLVATITKVSLNGENRAVVEFQLTDGDNVAITDLELGNIRFVIAKLAASPLGNLTGNWQSYINRIETAGSVGTGTEDKLQATSEREGELVNNGDGTYVYTFATSLTDLPADILAQAETEGIDLSFEGDRTHRVAIQFDGSRSTANPSYNWVPNTGAPASFTRDIAATENCNRCHDPLGIHGGNRREIEYCVTCHNAGSTDANSGNTVDLKVMVHKIHMGHNLPSVQAGGEYAIFGFRDSKHDYSGLRYPQDIRNCVNCHAGTGTVGDRTDLVVTAQGDNWAEVPSRDACGSCHEDVVFSEHRGGQTDDSRCGQCHSSDRVIGAHRMLAIEARDLFLAQILGVSNSMPGETPVVTFRVQNPQTGENYDILNDPEFTGDGARLAVGLAWSTGDYTNTGNGAENASQVQANALSSAIPNGDGSYNVVMPIAIPDGSMAPGIAVSGSGVAAIEGHPVVEIEGELEEIPVGDVVRFFSIDEPDGDPVPRRYADDQEEILAKCHSCHATLSFHGGNRTDNLNTCVTCHNPRNTDKRVRAIASDPPTDGKDEESLDFKTMIHGIHAAAIRENPLQIVGFRGFTTYRYTEEEVHYPGNLANCATCHVGDSFALPLADSVLGTTVDTGADAADPTDDTVVSPVSAVCSSCHDGAEPKAHMESQGGNFATTQAAIDSGAVVETCSVCHGAGRANDAWVTHQSFLD